MKILNVAGSIDRRDGGTSERTIQMSRAMYAAGADVRILTTNKGMSDVDLRSFPRERVVALPLINTRLYLPAPSGGLIRDLVADSDVVHLISHWTYMNAAVALSAMRLHKPFVLSPAGALKVMGASQRMKVLYNAVIGKRMIRETARLIAITEKEIEDFDAFGVERSRVVVMPNAVEAGDYDRRDDESFRRKFGLGSRPFALFLGRLAPIKGPDLLLEAFLDCCPQYDLVFAGPDGGLLESLRARAAGNRVHFIGMIGGVDKSHALHAASLLVIPSRREAMSIVALEAAAAARPVLLTDACGFDEVEKFGGGKVVSPDVRGIRAGLFELLSDPDRLKEMGERNREACLRMYSWTARAGQFLRLYEEILSTAGSPGRRKKS